MLKAEMQQVVRLALAHVLLERCVHEESGATKNRLEKLAAQVERTLNLYPSIFERECKVRVMDAATDAALLLDYHIYGPPDGETLAEALQHDFLCTFELKNVNIEENVGGLGI